jgi:dihydrofolate reductase
VSFYFVTRKPESVVKNKMGKVTSDMSMSLDGFIAGSNDSVERPLGDGGERLHEWLYGLASWRERRGLVGGKTDSDAEVFDESFKTLRAVVMGRGMFDGGEGSWGVNPPFHMPVFVLIRDAKDMVVKEGGTTFTFASSGFESSLKQAKAAAGDKDVAVIGGANTVRLYLKAGLLDEIQIRLVPVLLGEGRRLFDHMACKCHRTEDELTNEVSLEALAHIPKPTPFCK